MNLHLALKPSKYCAAWLIMIHLGAAICVLLTPIPLTIKTIGALFCAYLAWHTCRQYAFLSAPKAIVACTLLHDKIWQLKNRSGEEFLAELRGDTWRSTSIVLLNFKIQDSRRRMSVILFKDALEPTALRHLGVYLTIQ